MSKHNYKNPPEMRDDLLYKDWKHVAYRSSRGPVDSV